MATLKKIWWWILLIVTGGLFYYKNKADKAGSDAIINKAKGRDEILKEQQDKVQQQKAKVDQEIDDIKKNKPNGNSTDPDERANKW